MVEPIRETSYPFVFPKVQVWDADIATRCWTSTVWLIPELLVEIARRRFEYVELPVLLGNIDPLQQTNHTPAFSSNEHIVTTTPVAADTPEPAF